MTEERILELYRAWLLDAGEPTAMAFTAFKAGYLAGRSDIHVMPPPKPSQGAKV